MVTWLITILCFFPQQDIDAAKARLEAERQRLAFTSAKQEDTNKPVSVTWEVKEIPVTVKTVESTVPVTEHWLVSEDWCTYCPAAKRKFLAEGHSLSNIIDIKTAVSMGISWGGSIPYRFTTVVNKSIKQASHYRKEWPPVWDLNGNRNATKAEYLNHLRNNANHKNKFWQSWNLESWSREQLAALHSDDHNNKVISISEDIHQVVEKTTDVAIDSTPNFNYTVQVLQEHLLNQADTDKTKVPMSSLFDLDVDAPEVVPTLINTLLIGKTWSNGTISLSWEGNRSISIVDNKFVFNPAIKVCVEKSIVKFNTELSSISASNNGKVLVFDLKRAPDITINFR